MTDDITDVERSAITSLVQLTEMDLALAQRAAASPWVGDALTDAEGWAIDALRHFASQDLELARTLLDRVDADPSGETTALLTVLSRIQESAGGLLYNDLLQAHFAQSRTVSLPLAGEVNLWAFQSTPFTQSEDLTAMIEEAVQATEEFMGVPFPVTDVIMAVPMIGDRRDHGFKGGGLNWGNIITVTRYPPDAVNRRVVHHEVAHYYFRGNIGPQWLVEGGANFLELYTLERIGRLSIATSQSSVWQLVEKRCLNEGIDTIQELNRRTNRDGFSPHSCAYVLGEYFLIRLYETIGKDALSAALRELHLSGHEEPRPTNEEEVVRYEQKIYKVLLKHTPTEKEDAFRELYTELHGGPYAD